MSDAFDRREDGFEKRFVMSEELRFKALARRNKALGLWTAERLGRSSAEAEAYADALVAAQVGRSDADLAAALASDFAAAGLDVSVHRIERKMAEAMTEALASLEAGR
jgi:hypothetical protein